MFDKIALILTVIGGINWGLIGFFQFDLVAFLCGGGMEPLLKELVPDLPELLLFGRSVVHLPALPGRGSGAGGDGTLMKRLHGRPCNLFFAFIS